MFQRLLIGLKRKTLTFVSRVVSFLSKVPIGLVEHFLIVNVTILPQYVIKTLADIVIDRLFEEDLVFILNIDRVDHLGTEFYIESLGTEL